MYSSLGAVPTFGIRTSQKFGDNFSVPTFLNRTGQKFRDNFFPKKNEKMYPKSALHFLEAPRLAEFVFRNDPLPLGGETQGQRQWSVCELFAFVAKASNTNQFTNGLTV